MPGNDLERLDEIIKEDNKTQFSLVAVCPTLTASYIGLETDAHGEPTQSSLNAKKDYLEGKHKEFHVTTAGRCLGPLQFQVISPKAPRA